MKAPAVLAITANALFRLTYAEGDVAVAQGMRLDIEECRADTYNANSLVPDPNSFFLPHRDNIKARCWAMCLDDEDCSGGEATGLVCADFKVHSLVLDFQPVQGYEYDDVSVVVENSRVPTSRSPDFTYENGDCI